MVNSRNSDLAVFDLSWKTATIRYGIIFLLALINAHLRYGKMPLSLNYEFPLRAFFSVAAFGVVICSASWVVTWLIRKPIFKNGMGWESIYKFLLGNSLVAILAYTILYLAAFGVPADWLNFSAYLFVTLAIIIIENLFFVLYAFHNSGLEEAVEVYNSHKLTVPMGNRQVLIEMRDIVMVHLEDGIVCVHVHNAEKLRTQFQTLDQVQELLPALLFFRANRKTLLSWEAIREVHSDTNRKARILVKSGVGVLEVPVSRYKKKEVLKWISNQTIL